MAWLTEDVLLDALGDALAVVREFDGGSVYDKLAALGVDAHGLTEVLGERWEAYAADHGDDQHAKVLFVRAFAEGLITGLVAQRNRDTP